MLTVPCAKTHCRYFDSHGNYYLKQDPESVQDEWLQEVDWNKVCHVAIMDTLMTDCSHTPQVEEQREWKEGGKSKSNGGGESGEDDSLVDSLVIYKQILEILKPGETVVKVTMILSLFKSCDAVAHLVAGCSPSWRIKEPVR